MTWIILDDVEIESETDIEHLIDVLKEELSTNGVRTTVTIWRNTK